MRAPPRAPARAGTTFLELVVGLVILTMILGSIGSVSMSSARAWQEGRTQAELSDRARRTLDRLASELYPAGASGLVPQPLPPLGSSSLRYQRGLGFGPAGVNWGAAMLLEQRLETTELDDGIDNDGDGLVDEGQLVWVRDFGLPTQMEVVWARGLAELQQGEVANGVDDNGNGLIDEQGLSFELAGRQLTMRLSLQGAEPSGAVQWTTAQTSIRIRN